MDTEITQIVEEGKLRPLLDSTSFTFDEVARAHEYLESNKAIGKIVLKNVW
ncbi:zinc-binding dehydrogenase [Bacillus anthracis]